MNTPNTNGFPERTPSAEDRRVAEKLEQESPEGRPAHPEIGRRKVRLLLLLIAMVTIVAGVLISVFYQPITGVVVAILGLILIIFNPMVWVSLLRGQEVDEARDDLTRHSRPATRH